MEGVAEHLKCPICDEIPLAKIFQCHDGHVLCADCYERLVSPSCPQCRRLFDPPSRPIRNRLMEGLVDKLDFPCGNREAGCSTVLKKGEVRSHKKTCDFRDSVNICQMLGYTCEFEISLTAVGDGVRHLLTEHQFVIVEGENQVSICYRQWDKGTVPSVGISWTPVIFKLSGADSYGLVYSAAVTDSSYQKKMTVQCILLEGEDTPTTSSPHPPVNYMVSAGIQAAVVRPLTKLSRQTRRLSDFPARHIFVDASNYVRDNAFTIGFCMAQQGENLAVPNYPAAGLVVNVFPVRKGLDALEPFQCDVCGNIVADLVPVKYICLNCPQLFTICQRCMMMSDSCHGHHLLAMVLNRGQEKHLLSLSSSSRQQQEGEGPRHQRQSILEGMPPQEGVQVGRPWPSPCKRLRICFSPPLSFTCKNCGTLRQRETFYHCLYCPGGWKLCRRCVDRGVHSACLFAPIQNTSLESYVDRLEAAKGSCGIIITPQKKLDLARVQEGRRRGGTGTVAVTRRR